MSDAVLALVIQLAGQLRREAAAEVERVRARIRQAQLAASIKQEELTRLKKKAAMLATELGSNKQSFHLEQEAS